MSSRPALLRQLLRAASHRPEAGQKLGFTRNMAARYLHAHETSASTHLRNVRQNSNFESSIDAEDVRMNLNPFAKPTDEVRRSFIDDLNPPLKKSFNLAAYVNSSKTLQELIKIGVSLYDIENIDIEAAKKLVLLDFERDCMPYMKFLVKHGLKPKNLGRFISEFPTIFQVPLADLEIRIKYYRVKKFSATQIAEALNRSSRLIAEDIESLDFKLGKLQVEFKLPATLIREIVSKYPPIISLPEEQYRLVNFTLFKEFGFKPKEIHLLLRAQPKMLDILRPVLIERIDLVHNIVGLSHKTIVEFPKLITGPKFDIRHRFLYLKKLERNQFDPKLPLYVPPTALYNGSDEKFCKLYAKTNLDDYKLFLRSL